MLTVRADFKTAGLYKQREASTDYFPALTGIRAVAAYLVFLHHYNSFGFGQTFNDFISSLHIGVTVFFVLSGFLIAYRYYDEDKIVFHEYFLKRFARIYPVYFLLTSATFLVSIFISQVSELHNLKIYLLNITFLKGFFDDLKFTGIAQGWTLTVEETFYFLAPLLFIFIKRKKYNLVLIPLVFILVGSIIVHIASKLSLNGFFNTDYFYIGYTFFGRSFEFFVGISLALFFKANRDKIKTTWSTYLGLSVIAICICTLTFLKQSGNFDYGVKHPFGLFTNNFLLPLFGVSLLFWGLLTEKTLIQEFLQSKLMVLLGKSSYIFYLIHAGIFYYALTFITQNLFLIFILLNLISIVIFLYIEQPLNLFFRRSFNEV